MKNILGRQKQSHLLLRRWVAGSVVSLWTSLFTVAIAQEISSIEIAQDKIRAEKPQKQTLSLDGQTARKVEPAPRTSRTATIEEGSMIRDGSHRAESGITAAASTGSSASPQSLPSGPIVVDFRTRELMELKRIARELGGSLLITIETRGIAPADLIVPLKNSGLFEVSSQDGRVFIVTSNVEAQKRRLEEEIEALSRRQAALLQNIGVLEKFREGRSASETKPEPAAGPGTRWESLPKDEGQPTGAEEQSPLATARP